MVWSKLLSVLRAWARAGAVGGGMAAPVVSMADGGGRRQRVAGGESRGWRQCGGGAGQMAAHDEFCKRRQLGLFATGALGRGRRARISACDAEVPRERCGKKR